MAFLPFCGQVWNFFVRPVDAGYHASDAELARERALRGEGRVASGGQMAARGGLGIGIGGVLAWLAVGIPFLVGLYIVSTKVAALF
jgi:hypothetical protein